jgi:hypothetical protein
MDATGPHLGIESAAHRKRPRGCYGIFDFSPMGATGGWLARLVVSWSAGGRLVWSAVIWSAGGRLANLRRLFIADLPIGR